MDDVYEADRSLKGKLRRRIAKLRARRAARAPAGPMISFAFDDVPVSAATLGAEILESRGLKGSYYVAAGMAGGASPMGRFVDAADVAPLAEAGHEIGCHTFSHLDCGRAGVSLVMDDVERNRETLAALGLPAPTTFAYPYGEVATATKRALGERFALMRALHHGLVTEGSDLNQAPCVGIEGPKGERVARSWLKRAAGRRAWLILYTHDVAETPSPYGCTPGALTRLADAAIAEGFEVVTLAEGARRLSA
jgi:peptidoglycan/xylan/chitin deacetylase (PgdA/CDA1 family)